MRICGTPIFPGPFQANQAAGYAREAAPEDFRGDENKDYLPLTDKFFVFYYVTVLDIEF
jgi:hypothetical protein